MESTEEISYPPTNKQSIISLIFGILTLLVFCGGLMPIPFTGFICFPSSFVLGFLALTYGAISLRRIKKHNESGHSMAWIGIAIGGFIFFCILLFVIGIASLFIFAPDTMQPLIDSYSI
ncbi:MAG: DUF4190 domain-containing protein [Anaerolineales bacterium]|nr:DUF4190 domain-containing protein [Anaerolineales bacterium]